MLGFVTKLFDKISLMSGLGRFGILKNLVEKTRKLIVVSD